MCYSVEHSTLPTGGKIYGIFVFRCQGQVGHNADQCLSEVEVPCNEMDLDELETVCEDLHYRCPECREQHEKRLALDQATDSQISLDRLEL